MVRTFFLITAVLVGIAISAPNAEKSLKNIVTEVFGPTDTWTPIYLKDIDPSALIDGLPINSSAVYGHILPTDPALTHLALSRLSSHFAPRCSLMFSKRQTLTCYRSGLWLLQSQLWSVEVDFCNKARDDNISNGGSTWQDKEWWKDTSGNYQHFVRPDGNPTSVFFYIKINPGFLFNWSVCYNAFFDVIRDCHGTNPDTAGGRIAGTWTGSLMLPLILLKQYQPVASDEGHSWVWVRGNGAWDNGGWPNFECFLRNFVQRLYIAFTVFKFIA